MMQGRDATATRNRILDACEQVYALEGVEGLTLRTITERAAVNLASVNYHFGTKEILTTEMLRRHMSPVHQDRLFQLNVVESACGDHLRPTHVLGAIMTPMLLNLTLPNPPPHLHAFVLRCASDPATIVRQAVQTNFQHVSDRIDAAFHRSAPSLSREEAVWRSRVFFNAFPGTVTNQNTVTMLVKMLEIPNVSVFDVLTRFGSVLECVMHRSATDDTVATLVEETLDLLAHTPTMTVVAQRMPLRPPLADIPVSGVAMRR